MHQPASNRSRTAWSLERRPSPVRATWFEGAFPMVRRSRSIARILGRPASLTSSDGWSTSGPPTCANLPERIETCDLPTRKITSSGGSRAGGPARTLPSWYPGARERGDVGTPFVRESYEILSVLGHGGQGRVARALDHQHDRVVALKILEVGSEFERRGLLREARDAAQPAAASGPPDHPRGLLRRRPLLHRDGLGRRREPVARPRRPRRSRAPTPRGRRVREPD